MILTLSQPTILSLSPWTDDFGEGGPGLYFFFTHVHFFFLQEWEKKSVRADNLYSFRVLFDMLLNCSLF